MLCIRRTVCGADEGWVLLPGAGCERDGRPGSDEEDHEVCPFGLRMRMRRPVLTLDGATRYDDTPPKQRREGGKEPRREAERESEVQPREERGEKSGKQSREPEKEVVEAKEVGGGVDGKERRGGKWVWRGPEPGMHPAPQRVAALPPGTDKVV